MPQWDFHTQSNLNFFCIFSEGKRTIYIYILGKVSKQAIQFPDSNCDDCRKGNSAEASSFYL